MPTATDTATATNTPIPTATETATQAPTEVATVTASETATETPTSVPAATETATPSITPTVAPPIDTDGDGCPDAREASAADWHTGGERDPLNPWDFYDVPRPAPPDPTATGPRDGSIGLGDVIATLAYVGTHVGDAATPNGSGVTYDSTKDGDWFNLATGMMGPDAIVGPEDAVGRRFDRTPSVDASKPWQTGPPNGAITIGDVLIQLNSVGTNCN